MAPDFFLLRARDADGNGAWVCRALFRDGWSTTRLVEKALHFGTREEAISFAREGRIPAELVTLASEAVSHAT